MFVLELFIACSPNTQTSIVKQTEEGNIVQDLDGDGFISSENGGEDCDDNDGSIFPDAVEKCDGVDNNCDEQIDEDVTSVYFLDQDGDFGGDNHIVFTESLAWYLGYKYFKRMGYVIDMVIYKKEAHKCLTEYVRSLNEKDDN